MSICVGDIVRLVKKGKGRPALFKVIEIRADGRIVVKSKSGAGKKKDFAPASVEKVA